MKQKIKLLLIAGARPNFMKVAPLIRRIRAQDFDGGATLDYRLVHTGQHYDEKMSGVFFQELGIPLPDINLEVGSGSHAVQTANIITRFEPVCIEEKPDWVVVVGDVNSSVACALVAAKLGIKVAHVEAGLRSFDRTMPEEINRLVTDALASLLFTTSRDADENLRHEGADSSKIFFVGNVMIDTLLKHKTKAAALKIDKPTQYALVTLHRPSNVDDPNVLRGILEALEHIAKTMPVLFPIHPRTAKRIQDFGLSLNGIRTMDPLGYLEFLNLESTAAVVLTDSGGAQEETAILGVPCLTLRNNTERPVTITHGTNIMVGPDKSRILDGFRRIMSGDWKPSGPPEFWDGHASERIVRVIRDFRGR